MKLMCLMTFFIVSCGSEPISQPFLAQAWTEKEQSKVEDKASKAEVKTFAGKLTFHGLSKDELADFRVIPEKGKKLIVPENKRYEQVDGFWWKGSKANEWFKIPGSSEAWVGKGEAPKRFEGKAHREGLKVHTRSNVLVKLVGALKKGSKRPSWVSDSGETKSPVPSPWAGKREN